MTNKPYQVEGDFQMGRVRQHYTLQIVSSDEKAANERVYALLGSRHGVNRRQIAIASTKTVANDDVTDPVARKELGLK